MSHEEMYKREMHPDLGLLFIRWEQWRGRREDRRTGRVATVAERGNAGAPRNQVGNCSTPAADTQAKTSWSNADYCHDLNLHQQPFPTVGRHNVDGAASTTFTPSETETRFPEIEPESKEGRCSTCERPAAVIALKR